jgi:hypothetical protein
MNSQQILLENIELPKYFSSFYDLFDDVYTGTSAKIMWKFWQDPAAGIKLLKEHVDSGKPWNPQTLGFDYDLSYYARLDYKGGMHPFFEGPDLYEITNQFTEDECYNYFQEALYLICQNAPFQEWLICPDFFEAVAKYDVLSCFTEEDIPNIISKLTTVFSNLYFYYLQFIDNKENYPQYKTDVLDLCMYMEQNKYLQHEETPRDYFLKQVINKFNGYIDSFN